MQNKQEFPVLSQIESVPSPSLVVFPEKIRANIQLMIKIAGGPERLRPHVKTHKMAEVVVLQKEQGIGKFKCATMAEMRMLLTCQVKDILLAMQPVGPVIPSLVQLSKKHPDTQFSTLVDNSKTLKTIETLCDQSGANLGVYLDINCGMNRTGIVPSEAAKKLYQRIHQSESVALGGLHVYDGHIRDSAIEDRAEHCRRDWEAVNAFIDSLEESALPIPNIIAGGSPTFPVHARREGVDLSPGTTLLWDFGYGDAFPDLPFQQAAFLLTRVLSKPSENLVCLDLGHKSVAAEMPHPRVRLLGLEDAAFVSQSEEHLVIETEKAASLSVGDIIFGIPRHICPTVALHNKVVVATDGKSNIYWEVVARDRILD
ncbi:D-TA family PLP-dependent enzyme [Opitutaceae bacterium]|nr:D-TA family PLP-dependent enzyme [Opitutaceae bacterium]